MTGQPPGSSGCCLPRVAGVSYLRVGFEQQVVGMVGLQAIYEQLWSRNCDPEDVTDAELITMARRSNYIPNVAGVEAEYAAALRQAYTAFVSQPEVRRDAGAR